MGESQLPSQKIDRSERTEGEYQNSPFEEVEDPTLHGTGSWQVQGRGGANKRPASSASHFCVNHTSNSFLL